MLFYDNFDDGHLYTKMTGGAVGPIFDHLDDRYMALITDSATSNAPAYAYINLNILKEDLNEQLTHSNLELYKRVIFSISNNISYFNTPQERKSLLQVIENIVKTDKVGITARYCLNLFCHHVIDKVPDLFQDVCNVLLANDENGIWLYVLLYELPSDKRRENKDLILEAINRDKTGMVTYYLGKIINDDAILTNTLFDKLLEIDEKGRYVFLAYKQWYDIHDKDNKITRYFLDRTKKRSCRYLYLFATQISDDDYKEDIIDKMIKDDETGFWLAALFCHYSYRELLHERYNEIFDIIASKSVRAAMFAIVEWRLPRKIRTGLFKKIEDSIDIDPESFGYIRPEYSVLRSISVRHLIEYLSKKLDVKSFVYVINKFPLTMFNSKILKCLVVKAYLEKTAASGYSESIAHCKIIANSILTAFEYFMKKNAKKLLERTYEEILNLKSFHIYTAESQILDLIKLTHRVNNSMLSDVLIHVITHLRDKDTPNVISFLQLAYSQVKDPKVKGVILKVLRDVNYLVF